MGQKHAPVYHDIVQSPSMAFSLFLSHIHTHTHCWSLQMPEEEAFCVFVRLMQEYRLRELFKPSMAELGLCIYQFEYMLQVSRRGMTTLRLSPESP